MKPNTTEYKNEFNRNKYDRLNLTVPKGQRDIIANFAKSMGMSLNAYVIKAIKEAMERDGFKQSDVRFP